MLYLNIHYKKYFEKLKKITALTLMPQEPYTAVHMPMVTMSFYKNTTFTGMQDNFLPLKFGT
jgi:hypothetical protein